MPAVGKPIVLSEVLGCFRSVRDEMRRVFEAYATGLRDAIKPY